MMSPPVLTATPLPVTRSVATSPPIGATLRFPETVYGFAPSARVTSPARTVVLVTVTGAAMLIVYVLERSKITPCAGPGTIVDAHSAGVENVPPAGSIQLQALFGVQPMTS